MITLAVLLDVSDLDVGIITIKNDGKLVFNQGQSIKIRTKGIHVKDNAALIIGSSDCRHEDEVNIVLKGKHQVFVTSVIQIQKVEELKFSVRIGCSSFSVVLSNYVLLENNKQILILFC